MENLRYFLLQFNATDPLYFGRKFKPFTKQGYMSGGAGYVLSKKAVQLFAEKGLPDEKACKKDDGGAEDAEMGICLEKIGVVAGNSRDSEGRGRFFPFIPEHHVMQKYDKSFWYWQYNYHKEKEVSIICSSIYSVLE